MIDILMATYNGATYLEAQLTSIEHQTYKDWRLIVHDDGSTDGTWEILEQFQKRLGKARVIIEKNAPPSGGSKQNFMGLIRSATSDYMMCCDQDDVWHKDKIERTFHRMRQMETRYGKESPLLVYTDLCVVDEALHELHGSFHDCMNLRTGSSLGHELTQNQVTGCTVMINRALKIYADQTKDMDAIVMHDHWLALIALVFGGMSYVDHPTMDYRQHGHNVVGAQDAKSLTYLWQRFCRGRQRFLQDMKDSCRQAEYFLQTYAEGMGDKKTIQLMDAYAKLYTQNKIKRVYTFYKYGFWKKGLIRKIMQTIWG